MSSPWRKSVSPTERASLQFLPLFWSLVLLAAASAGLYLIVHAKGDRALINILGGLVLLGLVLSLWQGIKFMALLQAGTARLVLLDAPPAIGGRLKALVRLPGRSANASRVMVELACIRDGNSKRDAPNPFASGKVWTAQHEFALRHEGGTATAEFEFAIPATCLPSGIAVASGRDEEYAMTWQVAASAIVGHELVEHRFDLDVPLPRPAQGPADWLRDFAAIALIVSNLIPVYMVLAGRADLASLAFLYYAENLVVCGFMFLRVLFADVGDVADKLGGIFFFALWLGGVSVFLGRILIGILLNPPRNWDDGSSIILWGVKVWRTIGAHIVEAGLVLAVLALVASHLIGFVQNYIRNGQYLQARVNHEVTLLMNRSVITFGAFFVLMGLAPLGSPKYLLAGLVIAKTGFEIWRYAHEKRSGAAAAGRSIITT